MVITGENDLESQYPELAVEFNIERNGIEPDKVVFTDNNADNSFKQNHPDLIEE